MRNVETCFEGLCNKLKDENKGEHGRILIPLNEAICKIKNSAIVIHICLNVDKF
uniref:hypothetical protein n=1 Tax=Borreliella californiensis TaxID=373543 RepID=UPI003B21FDCB